MIKILIALFLLPISINAQDFNHSHTAWDSYLKENVYTDILVEKYNIKTNLIDYNKNELLTSYIKELRKVKRNEFDSFSREQQLAFLINAYNAFTVKLILDNKDKLKTPPTIKDISSLLSTPWKTEFIDLFNQIISLDTIEHDLIRKNYNEERIHFALVCAAISCPKIQKFAFTADNLNEQLEKSKKEFFQNKTKNYYKNNTLYISKIFKWFEEDFTRKNTLKEYIAKNIAMSGNQYQEIMSKKTKTTYLNYYWLLNIATLHIQ